MSNEQKCFVQNYCGYKVEVIKIKEFVKDPQRGRLVRATIRYEDGFEVGALLKEDEIEGLYV